MRPQNMMDDGNLMNLFCIKECAKWILSHKYIKVGLEFAEHLHNSQKISNLLKNEIGFTPIVLESANRACGNCCADEVTARPRNIEAIVHFGRTCLTPTRSLPVLYVLYPSIYVDPDAIAEVVTSKSDPQKTEDLILVYDVLCAPSIEMVFSQLELHFPHLLLSTFVIPEGSEMIYHQPNMVCQFIKKLKLEKETRNGFIYSFGSRQVCLPPNKAIDDYNFIYIGPNNRSLEPLQMKFSTKVFYTLNPSDYALKIFNFTKNVLNRSKKIEQIKDAKTIGLLNTVIKGHKEISSRLKKLIASSGKRYYSFYMGRINEAKLANIVGVDVFVYIGCPESSLFDRIEDNYLYKNIVTPWELEVTLNPSVDWSMAFETDFTELLKEDLKESAHQSNDIVSLVQRNDENLSSVIARDPGAVLSLHRDGAAQALMALSWQGLNPDEGAPLATGTIVEGKKGIALGYESEPKE